MHDVSPELALVDPELAAAARDRLPGPGPDVSPIIAEQARRRRRRRASRLAVIVAALLSAVGVGVAVAVVVADGTQPGAVATDAVRARVLGARRVLRTPPKSLPASGQPGRVFTWNETEGAVFYQVTFVRNGKPFHSAETRNPWLKLPSALRFRPGTYRWSVRPAVAGESGIVLGDAVVVQTFRISRG